MLQAILITIAITAPLAALATSYVEYKKQYNLWDWLKDKVNAFRGRVSADVRITITVAREHAVHFEQAIASIPAMYWVKGAIRRRL